MTIERNLKGKKENWKKKMESEKKVENSLEWKNVSVEHNFDDNVFGFAMEEKFKLLNYTYTYINKMYDDISNFPRKHEIIKEQLVKASFELLEKISAGNYSHNKKYKKQMADEAVAKVKTLYFLLQIVEKNKMISTKMIHKLRLQLDNISKCLAGWRKAV